MKFVLSDQEKKEFQKIALEFTKPLSTSSKRIDSRHWHLFWEYITSGNFPITSKLETLVNYYFHHLLSSEPLNLPHETFLKELAELYAEHRTDVMELITEHLDGKLPRDWKTWREHRFITFMIPKSITKLDVELECQYDTLTGCLDVSKGTQISEDPECGEDWLCLDGVKYED